MTGSTTPSPLGSHLWGIWKITARHQMELELQCRCYRFMCLSQNSWICIHKNLCLKAAFYAMPRHMKVQNLSPMKQSKSFKRIRMSPGNRKLVGQYASLWPFYITQQKVFSYTHITYHISIHIPRAGGSHWPQTPMWCHPIAKANQALILAWETTSNTHRSLSLRFMCSDVCIEFVGWRGISVGLEHPQTSGSSTNIQTKQQIEKIPRLTFAMHWKNIGPTSCRCFSPGTSLAECPVAPLTTPSP